MLRLTKCGLICLWHDESGAILTAEAVLLGTAGVFGAVVGTHLIADSINGEMRDVAYSLRSLDQSYCVSGHSSSCAWTAGSGYRQQPVEESLEELRRTERHLKEQHREQLKQQDHSHDRPHGDRREFDRREMDGRRELGSEQLDREQLERWEEEMHRERPRDRD